MKASTADDRSTTSDERRTRTASTRNARLLTVVLVVSGLLAALTAGAAVAPDPLRGAPDDGSPDGAGIAVDVAGPVVVGQPFDITVTTEHIAGAAALEADLHPGDGALSFGEIRATDASTETLALPRTDGDVSVVAYRSTAAATTAGPTGPPPSFTVRASASRPGTLTLEVDEVVVTDADGAVLHVEAHRIVTIDVREGPGETAAETPVDRSPDPAPDRPANADRATATATADAELDLTGDGTIDEADVSEVVLGWTELRSTDSRCGLDEPRLARLDVDGDGCLGVADLQAVAGAAATGAKPLVTGAPDLGPLLGAAPPSTFVVTSTADNTDSNINDGICETTAGGCTLRAAIVQANKNVGPNRVEFAIPGTGVHTIQLTSPLPTIADTTGGLTIDGYSQPGSSANTDPLVSNAAIAIEVRGIGQQDGTASFSVTSRGNTFRGIAAYNAFYDIRFVNAAADANLVVGSFIGTNAAGSFGDSPSFTLGAGLWFYNGASENVVGTPALADRNVISGNRTVGVKIEQWGSNANVVRNNLVGLTPSGTGSRPNNSGFDLQWRSSANVIGGTGFNERNVISGNAYAGVDLSHTTTANVVIGNLIGTAPNGVSAPSWSGNADGLMIKDNPHENVVVQNVLAGNAKNGIWTKHNYTQRNTIVANRIGVGLDGTPLPNRQWGIFMTGQSHVIERNIIGSNSSGGIFVSNASGDNANYPTLTTMWNRVTRNSFIENNGMGIDVAPTGVNVNDPGDADAGLHDLLNSPELATGSIGPGQVAGTACAGCTVEVYLADSRGAGEQFLTSTTADGAGAFAISDPGVLVGRTITALAIDPTGNTSEFSPTVLVGTTPRVTPTSLSGGFAYVTVGGRQVAMVPNNTASTNTSGPSGTSSRVRFDLVAPATGAYVVEGEVVAATTSSNSLWVQVDGEPSDGVRWEVSTGTAAHLDRINDDGDDLQVMLAAGPHTITTSHREDGTGIATVRLIPLTTPTVTGLALATPADQLTLQGLPVSLQLEAVDPDGGVVTYSALNLPAGLSLDARSGSITGTPTVSGEFPVQILVADGFESASRTFTWNVVPTDATPVITNPGDQLAAHGSPITPLTIAASDPFGETVTFTATGLPAGLTIDPASGTVSGTPTAISTSVVTVTAGDPGGHTAAATFVWHVERAAFACTVDTTASAVTWTAQSVPTYYLRHIVSGVETYIGGYSGTSAPITKLYGTYRVTYSSGGTVFATTCDGPTPGPPTPPPFACTVDVNAATVTWTAQSVPTYYLRHIVNGVETYIGGYSGTTAPITKLYGTYKVTYSSGGTVFATTCDAPTSGPPTPPPFACTVDVNAATVTWTAQSVPTYYLRHIVNGAETYIGGYSGTTAPITKLYGTYKVTYTTSGVVHATTCDAPTSGPPTPPPFACTVDVNAATVTWTGQSVPTYYLRHIVNGAETYIGGYSGTTAPITKLYGTYKVTYSSGGTVFATTCDVPTTGPPAPPPFVCTVDAATSTVTWTNQGATTYYLRRAVNGVETYLGGVNGLSSPVTDPTRTYTVTYQVASTTFSTSCFAGSIDAATSTLSWADQGALEYRVAIVEADGSLTDLGAVATTSLAIADPTRRYRVTYVAAGKTYTATIAP